MPFTPLRDPAPAQRSRPAAMRWPAYLGVAVLASALIAIILFGPIAFVQWRHLTLSAKDQLDAEAAVRNSIIQLLGGAVVATGLYFTARGFSLTRQGHITDRYATAVSQLGHENLDVRVGGIYALERIARDSAADRSTVIDILATFVREHTRRAYREPSSDRVGADVQAAVYVLGRRPDPTSDDHRLDFYFSGLNDADLSYGNYDRAMFYYSRLDQASFAGASLNDAGLSFCHATGAAFTRAKAVRANFVNASYTRCWFLSADLLEADFHGCDLTGSDFGRRYAERGDPPLPPARLRGANFTSATLDGTILNGVDLSTATGLTRKQFESAITDENTKPPLIWADAD